MTDGRHIDPALGTLSGEGSHQLVRRTPQPFEAPVDTSREFPGEVTYYDRPVIKKSVWSWTIPAYYYVGGLSGGSAVLGAAATLFGSRHMRDLAVRSRWIATIGAGVSSVLLIHDLGRPSRFLYMLRVFRPTSPMSVGSWILVAFSTTAGVSAASGLVPGLRRAGDLAAIASGVLGLGLSGYTGVLVGNTVVPVWHRSHRWLPALFMASAASSAASLLQLFPLRPAELRAARMLGIAGQAADIAISKVIEHSAPGDAASAPLREGFSGFLWKAGGILTAGSLLCSLIPSRSPLLRRCAGTLGTAGALCLRFGIHYAGQRSATDPRATFQQQRRGQGAYAVTGHAAVVGPAEQRAFEP